MEKYQRDITGERFGYLVALKAIDTKKVSVKGVTWLFRCELCGGTTKLPRSQVTAGPRRPNQAPKTCGCRRLRHRQETCEGVGDLTGARWNEMSRKAARRGIPFTISMEDAYRVYVQQHKRCALTGVPLRMIRRHHKHRPHFTASLDRIDSSLGYVAGNIQWVHRIVNFMKQRFTTEDLVAWCRQVLVHQEARSN